jgi:hypothetical protein
VSRARVPRGRRPLLLALVLVVLLALAAGLLVAGTDDGDGDEDGLAALRDLPAVAAAGPDRRDDDLVDVRLRAGTDAAALARVVELVPDEYDGGTLRLGRALLRFDGPGDAGPEMLGALAAVAGVASPAPIELRDGGNGERLLTEVPRAPQAAPLARELVRRVAAGGRWPRAVDRVAIALAGAPSAATPPVVLRVPGGRVDPQVDAVLRAATTLAAREPRVSVSAQTRLGLLADDPDDAGAAWRDAVAALGLSREERDDFVLAIERAPRPEDADRRALLTGPADERPDRALALLRALRLPAGDALATTDLRFVTATVPGPSGARAAAAAARASGARTVRVDWGTPAGPGAGTGSRAPERWDLADAPAVVLRLAPGVARARSQGIRALRWDGVVVDEVPRLAVSLPRWADDDEPLVDRPSVLRRLARAVRAVGWPGSARVALPLGPGACADFPDAEPTVQLVSTSAGRARSAGAPASCVPDAAVRAARRAWDATAR